MADDLGGISPYLYRRNLQTQRRDAALQEAQRLRPGSSGQNPYLQEGPVETDQSDQMAQGFRQVIASAGPGGALPTLLTNANLLAGQSHGVLQRRAFDEWGKLLRRALNLGLNPLSQSTQRAPHQAAGGPVTGGLHPAFDYQGIADQQMMHRDAMQAMRDQATMRDLGIRGQAIQQNGMMDQQFRANEAFARLVDLLPLAMRRM